MGAVVFGIPPRRTRPSRFSNSFSTALALIAAATVLILAVMWALNYSYPD
jgi:hypothetical protein